MSHISSLPATKTQTRTLEYERKKTKRQAKSPEKPCKKRFMGHSRHFFLIKKQKKQDTPTFFSYLCSANERRTT